MLLKWKGWFIWVEQPDYGSCRQSDAAVPDSHLKTIYFKTLTGGVSCCLFKGSHCFKHNIFKRWCIIYLSVVCFTVSWHWILFCSMRNGECIVFWRTGLFLWTDEYSGAVFTGCFHQVPPEVLLRARPLPPLFSQCERNGGDWRRQLFK